MKKQKAKISGNFFQRHSGFFLAAPFLVFFITFVILPILIAIVLSFTNFNSVETPEFVGLQNYIRIFSGDTVFSKNILPNTILYDFGSVDESSAYGIRNSALLSVHDGGSCGCYRVESNFLR